MVKYWEYPEWQKMSADIRFWNAELVRRMANRPQSGGPLDRSYESMIVEPVQRLLTNLRKERLELRLQLETKPPYAERVTQ